MIKQYVMEAVKEAIKEAFKNLGLSAAASATQAADVIQGGQQVSDSNRANQTRSSKGKSKSPKPPPMVPIGVREKQQPGLTPHRDRPTDPPADPTPSKKGKGQGQAADTEWRLQASSVLRRECYFSDRLVVNYCFQTSAPLALSGPCRRKVSDRAAKHIDELFQACQTQDIAQAVEQGCLDEAWVLLSDMAEQCLCEPGGNFIPRSADWTPSMPSAHNKTRKALCSPSVAGLRKLYGRLSHLCNRPWDRSLAHKIETSLAGVRRLAPELPFFSGDGLQHAAPVVRQLLMAYEKQERDSILCAWRDKLRHEDHRIRSFVKTRTEQQLLRAQDVQVGPNQEGVRRPAVAVRDQAGAWTEKWNAVQDQDWSELSRLLQGVQRPQPCQVSMRSLQSDFCKTLKQ